MLADRPVRATFCVYDKPDSVGGPVTWIQRLIPMLPERGIEPHCLFLLHWGDTGPALESLRANGIKCSSITAPDRTDERVLWILRQTASDIPEVFVPNLVVAGFFAGRWMKQAGIPTIGVLHSDDDYYRAIQDEFVCGDQRYRVSSVVCVSKELERQVIARGAPGVNVRRIPYGIPIPAPAQPRSIEPFRIAYVGRLAQEQKRILDVARVFCRVVRELPGVEAVIYGDGPERDAMLGVLNAEGSGLPVTYGGVVSSESIQHVLSDTHVIALLSDYEGLPIALLEAMAVGCIPVCTKMRSGIEELVVNGESGIIVGDRSDAFVAAIKELRDSVGMRGKLAANARATASRFSLERCATDWAQLLRESRAGSPRSIEIPERLILPKMNESLESKNQRETGHGFAQDLIRRARVFAGRIRNRH